MKSRRPVEVDLSQLYDVLVVGGGNAAICAAMTAREVGSKVLMIEVAPKVFRGGNSRHTRNLRYLHDKGNDFLTGPYEEKECWEDLLRITEGETNEHLARFTIRQSRDLGKWMENHGCKFQPSLKGTLHLSRTNAFFLGGGKALMNAYYNKARQLGVDIVYETEVQDLMILDGKFISAEIIRHGRSQNVQAKAVVLASGGFEALDIIANNKIDFIISDIMMPKGDGEMLLKKVRESNSNIPIVVMITGFSEISDANLLEPSRG